MFYFGKAPALLADWFSGADGVFHISLVNLWHSTCRAFSVDLLFAVLFVLVMSGFGLVISNYSATMQQSMFVMWFCLLVVILMSGLFTPISSMPEWAQIITIFNPLKYFMEVMRMIYLKGSGFFDLLPQFGILLLFAVVFNSWAVISYRKNN